jgi:hypothetical protein
MSRRSALLTAAVVTGALYVLGFGALGSPPDANDAPGQVLDWFRDHEDAARTYAWTASLGMLAFAVMAGVIRGLLPGPSGDVFLLGAAAFIVETTVQAWIWAALALHPDTLAPPTARALFDVALFWGPLLTGATCMMIGAVTVLGLRPDPLIPRWLTVLGAIAFAEQAIETITVFGTDGFTAPGGDMNIVLGAGLTLVWLIGLVIWGYRELGSASRTAVSSSA